MEALADRFAEAPDWSTYLAGTVRNHDLWTAIDRHALVDEARIARGRAAAALAGVRHVLVLSEDWCGDAVNIVPWVARLVERIPGVDFKVLGRDANPDLMDAHLTGLSRSIPVVILYDAAFRELGWWGPRPAELQAWVQHTGLAMAKDERYREVRGWYARDRGHAILDEITALMERNAPGA